jgi:hypothetical protein
MRSLAARSFWSQALYASLFSWVSGGPKWLGSLGGGFFCFYSQAIVLARSAASMCSCVQPFSRRLWCLIRRLYLPICLYIPSRSLGSVDLRCRIASSSISNYLLCSLFLCRDLIPSAILTLSSLYYALDMRDWTASYSNRSYRYVYRVSSPSGPSIAWRRALVGVGGYVLYPLSLLCLLLLDGEDTMSLPVSTDGRMFEGLAGYVIISCHVFSSASIPSSLLSSISLIIRSCLMVFEDIFPSSLSSCSSCSKACRCVYQASP